IGMGDDNVDINPFVAYRFSSFMKMCGHQKFTKRTQRYQKNNHFFSSIDACLGVEGLPQSGTGQVSLFTGINAAQEVGKHFGPYPHSSTRKFLREASIFNQFNKNGGQCYFMNAFPHIYFEQSQKKNRWSCTTLMTRKAGISLNTIQEVINGSAITSEFTQEAWRTRLSIDIPIIKVEEAADRVITVAEKFDLVLVEYYLTDKAGHKQDMDHAKETLTRLDRFLLRLMEKVPKNDHTLLLTSDHGNLEDLSVKTHTRNRVPFFVLGNRIKAFYKVNSIQDVTPSCLNWYQSTNLKGG
ncbi:MAG: alkaline phosphatase family protein, partial [Balneolales bacterium]